MPTTETPEAAEVPAAVAGITPSPPKARTSRSGLHRWWRRKPINKSLVVSHRWIGLVLGLLLVVECTIGVILLYKPEIFRGTHGSLYVHSSGSPVSAAQALHAVTAAHPGFAAQWVSRDDGVYVVGDASYAKLWFVDPASGHINGSANPDKGIMGLLVNVHDCAFSCQGYPGYNSWFNVPVWAQGPTFLTGITRAGLILGSIGLVAIVLVLTSVKIWWPGVRRLKSRLVVRRHRGRFARDVDLHNLIGAIGLPFLLLWGVTGASFEFPVVEKVWLAVTAGDQPTNEDFSVTPNPAKAKDPIVSLDAAQAVATKLVNGTVTFAGMPSTDTPYYEFDIITGYGSYAHRLVYRGDAYVLIDAHDLTNVKVLDDGKEALSNRLYDKVFEPAHFGGIVNGWWRMIWAFMGLCPLLLLLTGLSTWLFRNSTRRRRRKARRTAAAAT